MLEHSPTAKLMKFLEENWVEVPASKQEKVEIDLSDLFPATPKDEFDFSDLTFPVTEQAKEPDPWFETVPF